MTYARFRADPSKVRVAIRSHGRLWKVTVAPRDGRGVYVEREGATPIMAVMRALRAASKLRLPGIDLDMQWAYDHPQGALAVRHEEE